LVDVRKALADSESKRAEAERDAAKAHGELQQAQEIVEQIASLPIGRRSVVQYHVQDFRTKFGHVYGDDFVKMLENKNGTN
jgi:hypothetical protein